MKLASLGACVGRFRVVSLVKIVVGAEGQSVPGDAVIPDVPPFRSRRCRAWPHMGGTILDAHAFYSVIALVEGYLDHNGT